MENYFELLEAAELRAPTVVRAEIAELKQKIEKAQKNLIDIDNRIAGYSKDTDPKHANTVANKIRSAEREKKETMHSNLLKIMEKIQMTYLLP